MKRITALLLAAAMLLSLVACGTEAPKSTQTQSSTQGPAAGSSAGRAEPSSSEPVPSGIADVPADSLYSIDLTGITTLDELEARIEAHLAAAIASLNAQWETLSAEIDTYDTYVANAERVSDFYQTVVDETEQMCLMLYEYSAAYARMILESDLSASNKYDAIDGINACLYKDACDEIHDEIYKSLLDDMNDYFYQGILDDAPDHVDYSDWYEVCSEEYSQWYDTACEVYGLYYDAASEIYSFYFDMSMELYSRDDEGAEKVYERFLKKIARSRGSASIDAVAASL